MKISNMQLESKDYISISISILAVAVSSASFWFSLSQKIKETERIIRKEVSDRLESIIKINIELSKLKMSASEQQSEDLINLRRNYNSQKKILLDHVDYLTTKNQKLLTETDSRIMAMAFADAGDNYKANFYWQSAMNLSSTNFSKHINMRSYAMFLFSQGKFPQGRAMFEDGLKIDLPDTDPIKVLFTDTYIIWSKAEKNNNHLSEAKRVIELAANTCSRIGNHTSRKDIEKRINLVIKSFGA